MNNLPLKPLTSLNLIWIENQSFWVYNCSTCHKAVVKRKEASC